MSTIITPGLLRDLAAWLTSQGIGYARAPEALRDVADLIVANPQLWVDENPVEEATWDWSLEDLYFTGSSGQTRTTRPFCVRTTGRSPSTLSIVRR